jgi:ribosomal protein L11 methylase PrmA
MDTSTSLNQEGSFRDPRGHVFTHNGKIYRKITSKALADYHLLVSSGLYESLQEKRWLTTATVVEDKTSQTGELIVEHGKIPFISYPYEWCFDQLKAAALLQLDVHLEALKHGMTLSDASAYNIQFLDANPIFIDLLSFIRYEEGMLWAGHRQFCEHFLHPLLLSSSCGVPFNTWLRGNLEGLSGNDLVNMLPLRKKISPRILFNILTPLWLQKSSSNNDSAVQRSVKSQLPKSTLEFMLTSLRNWIRKLVPKTGKTTWGNYYEATHNYSLSESELKHRTVNDFIARHKPETVWDMGCNTGEYSETALAAGAQRVIGFDADHTALLNAYRRAADRKLAFLPLYQDAANPSPDQGWNGMERKSLFARRNADALIALAFEHHLVIGRNIPLHEFVTWLVSLAPHGLVEFIPKGDSNLDKLLRHREDIFDNYTEMNFRSAIESVADIERVDQISDSGRKLFWYSRR